MFGHPSGEINFSLCLTEFKGTAGISLAWPSDHTANTEWQVVPILAGAGSVVVAPFGYCPHGNAVNTEVPHHTRVSLDWRVISVDDMQASLASHNNNDNDDGSPQLGASATSGLPYTPGAYFGLWDATMGADGDWVDTSKKRI